MFTVKYVLQNLEKIKASLEKRKSDYPLEELLRLDKEYKEKKTRLQELQHKKNLVTLRIAKGEKVEESEKNLKSISEEIKKLNKETQDYEKKIKNLLFSLPNILADDVPFGEDESGNVEIRRVGEIKKTSGDSHYDIAEKFGWIDTQRAAKVAGSRFFYLKGDVVILENALIRFGLDFLQKKGYIPILPPYMIIKEAYEGVTSLSDFEEMLYKVTGKEEEGEKERYMIATAEHPIAAMYMKEVIKGDLLPLKYAGISPCFRREAGAHGKDTKGIFRVHQFEKVEQFIFCKPEQSEKLHEEILKNAEEIYKQLEIPYRVVKICTGDIGIVAYKKYDIEAYFPAQQKYKEICSISNCTDWQSLRLDIRYEEKGKKEYVHTLNGTLIAIQRTIAAILENYFDGKRVKIPDVLVNYVGKNYIP
ncbi:MAG: serine--tRNA ligase [Candidatus Micrarchaeales archaeon]